MKFSDLEFNEHANYASGFHSQAIAKFPNGYGASIVTGPAAYGEYEMAVIVPDGDRFEITYDTPITDDVIGNLTPESITEYLRMVEELPAKE